MTGLLAALLSLSLFSSLVASTPLPESSDLITARTPGCPSPRVFPNKLKQYYRTFTDPAIAGYDGGYYGFVADNYSPNFTVTDNTVNYPTWVKGKKRAVPGTWAKTGKMFAKGLTENLPKIRDVFDITIVGSAGVVPGEDAKCLQSDVNATFSAKLKRNFA